MGSHIVASVLSSAVSDDGQEKELGMARFSALQTLLGLLALSAQGVSDDPGGDDSCSADNAVCADVCTQLQESLGNLVIVPSDEFAYNNARTQNWYVTESRASSLPNWLLVATTNNQSFFVCCRSQTAWANPECIVRPDSTDALQQVVRTLVTESVPFAVRSGGHMTAPGYANTENGVLIDLSRFNDLNYVEEDSVVEIGTGLRWGEVYPVLDEYNVTVIGARLLGVGVGGFTLGSQTSLFFSFFSLSKYGH